MTKLNVRSSFYFQIVLLNFTFVILSDVSSKIKMNEELRKTTNKENTISINNYIFNDFLSGMLDQPLISMFGSVLHDPILKL